MRWSSPEHLLTAAGLGPGLRPDGPRGNPSLFILENLKGCSFYVDSPGLGHRAGQGEPMAHDPPMGGGRSNHTGSQGRAVGGKGRPSHGPPSSASGVTARPAEVADMVSAGCGDPGHSSLQIHRPPNMQLDVRLFRAEAWMEPKEDTILLGGHPAVWTGQAQGWSAGYGWDSLHPRCKLARAQGGAHQGWGHRRAQLRAA